MLFHGRWALCAFVALGVLSLTFSQPAAAELLNENLLAGLPAGYKVGFRDKKNNMLITEFVPTGETVDNWTEMVTVQVFYGLKAKPEEFMNNIESGWRASCKGSEGARPVAKGLENGYPSLVWLLSCPNNLATGRPELTWFKVMQGNDSFYAVQKAFRFMPSREQIGKWIAYLKAVRVCDSRLPDKACPASN